MNRIKVCCRIRPGKNADDSCIVAYVDSEPGLQPSITAANDTFCLDCVFDEKAEQHRIFEEVGSPCILDLMEGFNCSIFTYGQTGSGKSLFRTIIIMAVWRCCIIITLWNMFVNRQNAHCVWFH
jgi:hypothetical protein